jgi:hypothetical protein
MCGKVNFMNMSRYSDLSERTYRRQYLEPFDYIGLNALTIGEAIPPEVNQIAVMDCTFIPKSGAHTAGLDWFYNGSASRSEKGLELSVLAVVDVAARRAYTLSVQQTPARAPINTALLDELQTMLVQLPDKTAVTTVCAPDQTVAVDGGDLTRTDYYLQQVEQSQPHLPQSVKYLVVDGYYSKQRFFDGVVGLNLGVIGKLRLDANLQYLYAGVQKRRGRPRLYDGKVNVTDQSRLTLVKAIEPGLKLYTAVVWHISLKRKIRMALLVDTRKPGKPGFVLLFATDVNIDAQQILTNYQARFQIEFIFRDSKQFTGLADCQSCHPQKLDFHFNASLTALNLAKYQAQLQQGASEPNQKADVFSMASLKRAAFNDHLLERFISMLDLDATSIKSHPNYQNLRSYGVLRP